MISKFAVGAAVWLLADFAAGVAQELPSGGGPMPELRRGPNGQIEVIPAAPAVRPGPGGPSAAPAAVPPNPSPSNASPSKLSRGSAPPEVRVAAPPPVPAGPLRPVIDVRPHTPRVPDTAPGGTIVATYSVRMSDNSPFAGTVRFGPPYYGDNGKFTLDGNKIIVNPDGPGIGPNKATVTDHITLEAIPESPAGH